MLIRFASTCLLLFNASPVFAENIDWPVSQTSAAIRQEVISAGWPGEWAFDCSQSAGVGYRLYRSAPPDSLPMVREYEDGKFTGRTSKVIGATAIPSGDGLKITGQSSSEFGDYTISGLWLRSGDKSWTPFSKTEFFAKTNVPPNKVAIALGGLVKGQTVTALNADEGWTLVNGVKIGPVRIMSKCGDVEMPQD